MTIIQQLTSFVKDCIDLPISLWDEKRRSENISKLHDAVEVLYTKINTAENEGTKALGAVKNLKEVLASDNMEEYNLADSMEKVYEAVIEVPNPEIEDDLEKFKGYLDLFKYRAMHHKVRSEHIENICERFPPDELKAHDQKILKEKLVFYVLEYTLEVSKVLQQLPEEKQKLLIDIGLKVQSGNLPSLKEFFKSYQDEVVYSVCDQKERDNLLRIFLDYEAIIKNDDYDKIIVNLNKFNSELLKVALKFGITHFTGLILKPYPDNSPLEDIIKSLE